MKTAIVIGATGLVGRELIRLLLDDNRFNKILVFSRRSLQIKNAKLGEYIIDFDKPDTWQHLVKGDVLFSALGTTLQQAGGKQAQYKIDYTYQYGFADAAARNGVPVYVLVSSASADPKSGLFYTRMKGELERDIRQLSFLSINIIQPGLLAGKRQEERLGEKLANILLSAFNAIGLFKKYCPIEGKIVAQAMVNACNAAVKGVHVYALEDVFMLSGMADNNKS